jgi:hypothetical protein
MTGCDLVYFLTGHILVVSSSVHLHILLFSKIPADANIAQERLLSNFKILMQLKAYWSVIEVSVCEFQSFIVEPLC